MVDNEFWADNLWWIVAGLVVLCAAISGLMWIIEAKIKAKRERDVENLHTQVLQLIDTLSELLPRTKWVAGAKVPPEIFVRSLLYPSRIESALGRQDVAQFRQLLLNIRSDIDALRQIVP